MGLSGLPIGQVADTLCTMLERLEAAGGQRQQVLAQRLQVVHVALELGLARRAEGGLRILELGAGRATFINNTYVNNFNTAPPPRDVAYANLRVANRRVA